MSQSRRKPKKAYYMKQLEPLWIFKVKSKAAHRIYKEQGCVDITKQEYNSYPEKGKQ